LVPAHLFVGSDLRLGTPNARQVFIPHAPIVRKVHSLGTPSQSALTDQLI